MKIDKKLVFNDLERFQKYLREHPEIELKDDYDVEPYKLIDVVKYSEWERLRQIILGFGEYDKFFLLQDLETNLLYLGDVNLGGHLPQARITRIQREDIFEKSEFLKSWYQNYSEKFWLK